MHFNRLLASTAAAFFALNAQAFEKETRYVDLHDSSIVYDVYIELAETTNQSVAVKALLDSAKPDQIDQHGGQKTLILGYAHEKGTAQFALACKALNCIATAHIPFSTEPVANFRYDLDRDSSIKLFDIFTQLRGRTNRDQHDLAIGDGLALHCERESARHIPECQVQLANRFDHFNSKDSGYPDPIEIFRDAQSITGTSIILDAVHFGSSANAFASELFELLPFKFDHLGTTVNGYEEDLGSADCRKYDDSYSCFLRIDLPNETQKSFSIPLNLDYALTREQAEPLSKYFAGKKVSGYVVSSESKETDHYIHKNKHTVVRQNAEIDCTGATCHVRLSAKDVLVSPEFPEN